MIAATPKRAAPDGVGSVNDEPTCRWCSSAKPLDTVAHPPARTSRVAPRQAAVQQLAGRDRRDVPRRAGDDPQTSRPDVEEPPLVDAHGRDARGVRDRLALSPLSKALVVRSLPPVVTHTWAVCRYSVKLASRPRSRSARAPPIATLPYTASAAMPASATERVVIARSSETTTISELLGTRSPAHCSARATPTNRLGITHRAASASAIPPSDRQARDEQHERGDGHESYRCDDQRACAAFPARAPRCRRSGRGRPHRSAGSGADRARGTARRASSRARRSRPRAGPCRRCRLSWVADREGGRQVGRDAMQERAREQDSKQHADGGRGDPEHGGLEAEQGDDLAPVIALHAQVGDEAAPLGHRQQHRVERQQEADHHADRGEQRRRLVVGPDRLFQQRQLVVGCAPR